MASVLVVPSALPESFSLVCLEAMAMKIPVIGTNIGGICELIDDGHTGFLVRPGDAEQLADAIKKFLYHPEKIIDMGLAGYNKYATYFSRQVFENKLSETLT